MAEDYIEDVAEAFDFEDADLNTIQDGSDDEAFERFFYAAIEEMVRYLFERFRDLDASVRNYVTEDNIQNVYVTRHDLEPTYIIVEFEEVPDEWQMENAVVREFLWHPNPGRTNQSTAAYFQPRKSM